MTGFRVYVARQYSYRSQERGDEGSARGGGGEGPTINIKKEEVGGGNPLAMARDHRDFETFARISMKS